MKKILFILLSFLLLTGCGSEESISNDNIEFELDYETLIENGYEELAGLAYCKLDYSSEKTLCYIQYESSYPKSAFYLMGSLVKKLDYDCDFVIVWNGKEYKFDDTTEENYEKSFPEEWKDTIEESQNVGIDNLVPKVTANTIDEAVERFLEKNAKEEEEEEETNIIAQKEFLVDNQKLTIFLSENGEDLKISAWGYAETEEKATLMLVCFKSEFDDLNIDYSIWVKCDEEDVHYMKNGENTNIIGTNRDGSMTLSMPDWIVSEFTMTEEEANSYASEILTAIKEFGEEME